VVLDYIASLSLGYLIGSFPTAYFLVKKRSQIDIRIAGSGNVGARNAYEVTRSRSLGLIILTCDLLKGAVAVIICYLLCGKEFWIAGVSGAGAVIGHNYPVWLNFRGGRGLATTAGAMILLCWVYVPVWLIVYGTVRIFTKDVHFSSIVASVTAPFITAVLPEPLTGAGLLFDQKPGGPFIICMIFSLVILSAHTKEIAGYLRSNNSESNSK